MIQSYEFTVILYQDDEKFKEGYDFVKAVLEKNGCEITKDEDLGLKMLAYPIKKQDKGHYVYFEFRAEGEKIDAMSKDLRLSTLVLKFLFVNPERK